MKDFRVIVKLKNNQLVERREAYGLSVKAFCEKFDLPYQSYLYLETLHDSPLLKKKSGETAWKPLALRISDLHRVHPDVLWPDAMLAVEKSRTELRMSAEDAFTLASADSRSQIDHVMRSQLEATVAEVVGTLSKREQEVIEMLYGDNLTLAQAADNLDVCTERCRQIEAKALRKLRHPSRVKILRPFVEEL